MVTPRADTFSGFLMSMFLVHLLQQGLLHYTMSPYDIFSSAMRAFRSLKWRETGIFMNQDAGHKNDVVVDTKLKEAYLKAFPVVFVDPSGKLEEAGGGKRRAECRSQDSTQSDP
jgi:hypothetical protein